LYGTPVSIKEKIKGKIEGKIREKARKVRLANSPL
jgi:hypothetical protein